MSTGMTVAMVLATASQLLGVPQPPAPRPPAAQPSATAEFDPVVWEAEPRLTEKTLERSWRSQMRKAQSEWEAEVRRLTEDSNLPRVVCGMTVLPADPSADRAMVKAPPSDRAFIIRSVKPPLCRD